jgi:curved DNA-binding protein CbpA
MILFACVYCNTIAHTCRMKSHYDVLGIPTNATQKQVVTAYRLRGKLLHPDRFGR